MPTIDADVLGLITDLHQSKVDAKWYQRSQELVVIAGHKYHPGAAFGMSQDPAYDVAVALFPSPLVALDLPGINDITNEIQGLAGMVLEEVIE